MDMGLGRENPAKTLARVIRQDLKVEVSEEALSKFICESWGLVSSLAHNIHRNGVTRYNSANTVVTQATERPKGPKT